MQSTISRWIYGTRYMGKCSHLFSKTASTNKHLSKKTTSTNNEYRQIKLQLFPNCHISRFIWNHKSDTASQLRKRRRRRRRKRRRRRRRMRRRRRRRSGRKRRRRSRTRRTRRTRSARRIYEKLTEMRMSMCFRMFMVLKILICPRLIK